MKGLQEQVRISHEMTLQQAKKEEDKVNKIKTNLRSLLQLARLKKIDDIYTAPDLFYVFHSICVKNVIFRTKWKKGRCREPYFKYTDESDEAFAFLVLMNNANRIEDMADPDKEKDEWRQPLFTEATNSSTYKTGRTSQKGRGWTEEAILMFAKLQERVCKYRRSQKDLMVKLGRDVLQIYRINYGNEGAISSSISIDDDYNETDKRGREDREKQLDNFFRMSAKRRCIGDTMIDRSINNESMPEFPPSGDIRIHGSITSTSMPGLPHSVNINESGNIIYGSTTSRSMPDIPQSGNIYSEHELSVEQESIESSYQSRINR